MKYLLLTLTLLTSLPSFAMETMEALPEDGSSHSSGEECQASHLDDEDLDRLVGTMRAVDLSSVSPPPDAEPKGKEDVDYEEPIPSTRGLLPSDASDVSDASADFHIIGRTSGTTDDDQGSATEDPSILEEWNLLDLGTAYTYFHTKNEAGQDQFEVYFTREQELEEQLAKERDSLSDDKKRKLERLEASRHVVEELERAIEVDDDKIRENDEAVKKANAILILGYLTDIGRPVNAKILTDDNRKEAELLINSKREADKALVKRVKKFIKDSRHTSWYGSWLSLSAWGETLSGCNVM